MYEVRDLKLPIGFDDNIVKDTIGSFLKIDKNNIGKIKKLKLSLDSRREVKYVLSVAFEYDGNINSPKVKPYKEYHYTVKNAVSKVKPVVIGFGPAGVFSALSLAMAGLNPIVLERGDRMDVRREKVAKFNETGKLDEDSNVQFGEGGAGAFSDGKLNSGIKDDRCKFVRETFVRFGASEDVNYLSKPHVGTDKLQIVLPNIRKEIERLGGTVLFNHKVVDFVIKGGKITGLVVDNGERYVINASDVVLATGHSARDVFQSLKNHGVSMEQKAFSMGVRVEHKREDIDRVQHNGVKGLPSADYKLAVHLDNGRSVYTFCNCPGGEVINSSSERGGLVVNGMSNYARNDENTNSAVLVNVTPSDFPSSDVLSGVALQRKYEQLAYKVGGGNPPCQLLGDFEKGVKSTKIGKIKPSVKRYTLANLRECLPSFVVDGLLEGFCLFDKKLQGFNDGEAVLTGVETRSSSPVRVLRDSEYESSVKGLYPAGEGAGYAGGIMSAAVDGLKIAEKIIEKYEV